MRVAKVIEGRKCPRCKATERQTLKGFGSSGKQRCYCNECLYKYTLEPKARAYPEEVRQLAIKEHYAGASGRAIGKIHGFSKSNVYNWIKKNRGGVDKSGD
jgi:transposase-like protein